MDRAPHSAPAAEPPQTAEDVLADGRAESGADSRASVVASAQHGQRLDKALVALAPEFSRSHLQTLIDRGYAFASVGVGDIDSDRKDVSDGVYRWIAAKNGTMNEPADRGTISAWAWGIHRCVDHLVTERRLDPKRIAVVGHSRNGKTALLAGAMDERIALAIPHQAGCGGTAPSRGTVGESVKRINTAFPHWFNGAYKQFNDDPSKLPFDQNCLVALMAPRPVLFGNAVEDSWANPAGQFEVLRGADSVYRLLKVEGCNASTQPPTGQLVKSRLGYFIRPGKHSMTADDWGMFMDFADIHFKGKKR